MNILLCLLVLIFFSSACLGQTKAAVCGLNEHWVRSHFRRAYVRANGTFVSATNVRAHCKKNQISFTSWKDKFQNQKPAFWPNKTEKSKRWTEEEIERVFDALDSLPEILRNQKVEGILRFEKAWDPVNQASSLPEKKLIALFNKAFSKDENLARLLAHELAHHYYQNILPKSEQLAFRLASNWLCGNYGDKYACARRKDGFVKEDGKTSPEEDFANNIDHFLFEPNKLRKTTPAAYEWIAEYFGDKLKLRTEEGK